MTSEPMVLDIPAELETALHLTRQELEPHIRLMAALKMFELGKLSSGNAAEFAGVSRAEFFELCGRYRVSVFNYPDDEVPGELSAELTTLKSLTRS